MRTRLQRWLHSELRSIQRVAAWTGTLLGHVLLVALLISQTRVVPRPVYPSALTVEVALELPAPPPPAPPVATSATVAAAVPATTTRLRRAPPAPSPQVTRLAPPAIALPEPTTLSRRIEAQRNEAAEAVAEAHAPERRPFAGRDLDAMLPDGDNGKLPGFKPQTRDQTSEVLRKLGRVLSTRMPSAAVDFDAPTDLLTEGWEAKHHGSDMAACERQYEELDADLRRQMCGDVRPPD